MRKTIYLLLLSACMMSWMGAGMAATEPGPRAVVETLVSGIIDVLQHRKDPTRLTEEDREKIRQVVNGRFDYAAMAKRSLGEPWNQLDAREQAHFTEIFRQLLERSYGNRLNDYKGQTVEYRKTQFKGSKARVLTIVSDGARETPVEYRLHQTDIGWTVYDIRIEGASLVRTFYQDFQTQLSHGTYQDLVRALEDKIARLKARG